MNFDNLYCTTTSLWNFISLNESLREPKINSLQTTMVNALQASNLSQENGELQSRTPPTNVIKSEKSRNINVFHKELS